MRPLGTDGKTGVAKEDTLEYHTLKYDYREYCFMTDGIADMPEFVNRAEDSLISTTSTTQQTPNSR